MPIQYGVCVKKHTRKQGNSSTNEIHLVAVAAAADDGSKVVVVLASFKAHSISF